MIPSPSPEDRDAVIALALASRRFHAGRGRAASTGLNITVPPHRAERTGAASSTG
ncbi:MAG: hypothetical protein KY464_01930 [Gemmatimonadetes bacterium]|nr:hypothetical protein [Gemmatimonadota bacterium]